MNVFETKIDALIEAIESTQNFLQGICFDPRVPEDTKQAIRAKIDSLDDVLGVDDDQA